ncbi:hypothetical protein LL946_14735 [Knoellia locipacati]|uniref:MauE/DoxX family redox-associated membrane protein n=1 Tax=Knoellia locipacati TaxID=882824 RepID=UPI00384AC061
MHHVAWVVAPLVLVAVIGFSAVTKLGKGESLRTIIRNLELPEWVLPRQLARAVPGIELALAAGLLTPWRATFTIAAAGTLVLMLTYWALIARGLSLTPRPHCGCFGEVGDQRISVRTLVRNTLLVAAATASLAVGLSGRTVWSLLEGSATGDWLWLGLGALACLVTGLVLGGSPDPDEPAATATATAAADPATELGDGDDEEDYVRTPTPVLAIHDPASGPVTLQELTRRRAQLLVFVNCYCASTKEVMAEITAWDARSDLVDVRLVFAVPIAEKFVGPPPPRTLLDHRGLAWLALGLRGSPSAVLLGVDDHLAGGPVSGTAEVREFVDDVVDALQESVAGAAPDPAQDGRLSEDARLTEDGQLTGDR